MLKVTMAITKLCSSNQNALICIQQTPEMGKKKDMKAKEQTQRQRVS